MPLPPATDLDIAGSTPVSSAPRALAAARRSYYEDPAAALAVAIRCYELASAAADDGLCARACALQGMVSLHRGDLRGALARAVEAERHAEGTRSAAVQAEVAALQRPAQLLHRLLPEALRHAELAVERADASRELALRVYARRATCPVFGNVGVPDLRRPRRRAAGARDRERRPLGGVDLPQRPRLQPSVGGGPRGRGP